MSTINAALRGTDPLTDGSDFRDEGFFSTKDHKDRKDGIAQNDHLGVVNVLRHAGEKRKNVVMRD